MGKIKEVCWRDGVVEEGEVMVGEEEEERMEG